jgi:HPt (histidine-containing phosphotransfer) domain-containing protein
MDMQMPGLSGDMLARLLRSACPQAILVCMSATRPPGAALVTFDAFILKPFTAAEFQTAIEGIQPARARALTEDPAQTLNQSIYDNLAQSMPLEQLRALYDMCLDDADQRIDKMRAAVEAGDEDTFVRGAHAIKGGCGMVGASELANLAAKMETDGLPPVGNQAPLERLDQFLAASQRLRRMLDAQTASSSSGDHA